MIRGHVALIRQLRSFVESSGLSWGAVRFRYEHDEDGRPYLDNSRIEIGLTHGKHNCDVVIIAPMEEALSGQEPMPLGRLVGRCGDRVAKGPIDQATWNSIVEMLNN